MSIESGGWVPVGQVLAGVDGRTLRKGDRLHVQGRYAGDFGFDVTVDEVVQNPDGSFTITTRDPNMPDALFEMYQLPQVVLLEDEARA